MSDNHLEVEVKLYVPDLGAVEARLQHIGAERVRGRTYERNIRYEDAGETFTSSYIVLRLRQDDRVRLTYKGPGTLAGDGIQARFEAEVEVSDFDTMHLILEKLGYHSHMIYEKYRTTYTLAGGEIVLDELPYGNFVEIEADAETIEEVIIRLELSDARRYADSYVLLFDTVSYNLGLVFTELTFANFDGVSVPESALRRRDGGGA